MKPLILLALSLGLVFTATVEWMILSAFFSSVKWTTIVNFNSYNEGMFELVIFTIVLLFQIIIIVLFAKGRYD